MPIYSYKVTTRTNGKVSGRVKAQDMEDAKAQILNKVTDFHHGEITNLRNQKLAEKQWNKLHGDNS